MNSSYSEAKSKIELGYSDNKEINIKNIEGIFIEKFRSLEKRYIELGKHITVLVGRNGTMKTSVMGLIAQPFNSSAKDCFGKSLKTDINEIFRYSTEHDKGPYKYDLVLKTENSELLKEPVTARVAQDSSDRYRVVVSGHEKGDGNFNYNTSFLNLKRLLPIIETNARPDTELEELSPEEKSAQSDFYETVLHSTDYNNLTPIFEAEQKSTFAPCGEKALYDYKTISSGEDNLGAIFNKIIGFNRACEKNNSNGIFCIDEIECGLHPAAQMGLFNYINKWSKRKKVQVVFTTHSLHLLQYIMLTCSKQMDSGSIVMNFFSKAYVGNSRNYNILKNPDYNTAYKELTLMQPQEIEVPQKINLLCEDEMAKHFTKLLLGRELNKRINYLHNLDGDAQNTGTTYTLLKKLCKDFSALLKETCVVFDADVTEKALSPIRDKSSFVLLPDNDNLAIERRIIVFILELNNDNNFFVNFKKEKEAFIAEFKSAGISSLEVNDVKDENKTSIGNIKKWVNNNKADAKKYITYYSKTISNEKFKNKIVERFNSIYESKGLPKIPE